MCECVCKQKLNLRNRKILDFLEEDKIAFTKKQILKLFFLAQLKTE